MPLHLYCIVPAERPLPDRLGLDGALVSAAAAAGVACWFSSHEQAPTPTAARLRAHNAVAAAAMDELCTPVPLRYGQALPDPAALTLELERSGAEWAALLARFAGHAEFGVRVETAAGALAAAREEEAREMHTPETNPGTRYMASLARRHAAAADRRAEGERIAAQIRERAAGVIRDCRVEYLTTPEGLISMANLVAWNGVATYHAGVDEVRTAHGELQFLCTGPWPPYSFVA